MDHGHLAWEFADLFAELSTDHINEMLAKNVPIETLEFFREYAAGFADGEKLEGDTRERLPNLMLVGYLLRVLEDRLIDEPDEGAGDA
ncbi:MAG: hypothetical protein QNK05_20695 [Myxococcota bacterium]|nr:hypothetical protein [Myxococcota bacterium]